MAQPNPPKTAGDLIQILRNVTGRVDANDPLFTDTIMLGYINDFLCLIKAQELRLIENNTWWEFSIDDTTPNPLPVDLQAPFQAPEGTQFTTIGPIAYIDGFKLFWYQDPGLFFDRWPETQEYQPTRPLAVLYYNNELLFRNPPNQQYLVKINAYKVDLPVVPGGVIERDYIWRYVAYGAALDLMGDYGEDTSLVERKFVRYRALVSGRTYLQNQNQRSTPTF